MLSYCAWTYFSPRCQYATGFTYFISANVTIFLLLFLNFYSKSYKSRGKITKDNTEKAQNGVKTDLKQNGVTDRCKKKENGVCAENCKEFNNLEEIPYEVEKGCGDYIKDGKMFITRRTAKAAYGPQLDFDDIIKK